MSRPVWAGAGATLMVLLLVLTPNSAMAAGRKRPADHITHIHRSGSSPAAVRAGFVVRRSALRFEIRHVLAPGAGYAQALGSRRVRLLQRRLDRLGFAVGPIDGRYGPLTTQAVERFQRAHGLTVDGIAGPHTLTALRARGLVTLAPGAGYAQALGSRRVRLLQRRLDRLGFAVGPIDGRYGPLTTQAVERFQRAHGLTVDGIAGPHTLTALIPAPRVRGSRQPVRSTRADRGRHSRPQGPAPRGLPAIAHPRPLPSLPTTAVLLVLAAAGLLTVGRSYTRTRMRLRPRSAQGRSRGPDAPRGLRAADRGGRAS